MYHQKFYIMYHFRCMLVSNQRREEQFLWWRAILMSLASRQDP